MASVSMSTGIGAPASAVWGTVSDFNGLPQYHPVVKTSSMQGSGVGAIRTLTLENGAEIVERLETLDDAQRSLSYRIITSPLPVENYVATMKVREAGPGRCEFEWSSTFDPKDAPEADVVSLWEGVYTAGFEGLKKLHGG